VDERRLVLSGAPPPFRDLAGRRFGFHVPVHRMRQNSDAAPVSIGAHLPRPWLMDSHPIRSDGTRRRSSSSYADDLRPVEVTA
jgi:hypothetical protein